jgi:phenylalanyl-tRNA synthetase alpha chain
MSEDLQRLIATIRGEVEALLAGAPSEKELGDLRVRLLGKKGTITGHLRGLKDLPGDLRGAAGKALNDLKAEIDRRLAEAEARLTDRARDERLRSEWVDITLDAGRRPVGSLHPTSRVQYEIEDIFTSMGFEILDGPHVETDYFNFEALNIPEHHPARDMQDTFYLEDGNLLRTHTSPIQVRGMQRLEPPFKIIGPGKVFRSERIDASHEATFHQLEGMMVDRDIQVAHLIYFEKELLRRIFGREVEVRLRPGYFPFVEPGFEMDVRCLICGGKGCPVCKQVGWVELVPCGMVHPNVLRLGRIDPARYSGFAFGLGLDRLVMMKYQIDDIRLLHGADLRFLRQFA